MTVFYGLICGGVGLVLGWNMRASVDSVLTIVILRILSTAIGKEKMAEALTKVVAGKEDK